jgi:hypothetical protein
MNTVLLVINTVPVGSKEKAKRWERNTKECLKADVGGVGRFLYTTADSIGYWNAMQFASVRTMCPA